MSRFALFTALALFSTGAIASPQGQRGHHGPPHAPPHEVIAEKADELGIDDATVAAIQQIAEDAKPDFDQIREDRRTARRTLRSLMEADTPDRSAILSQIEQVGQLDITMHQLRAETMLDIRSMLTLEQWRALDLKPKRERGHRGPPGDRQRGPGGPGFDR